MKLPYRYCTFHILADELRLSKGDACAVQKAHRALQTILAHEFAAIQSHRDAVLALQARVNVLATNEHTSIQAFSLDQRIFEVQFHPEMDGDILRRLSAERRVKLRGETRFDLDEALDSADANASRIFRNFPALLR